jgi:hypothetical protein
MLYNKKLFVVIIVFLFTITIAGCVEYKEKPATFNPLEENPNFILTKPPYTVIFRGEIILHENGTYEVELAPFFLRTDNRKLSNKSLSGQFTLILRKEGELLLEEPLDAVRCIRYSPVDLCLEYDHTQGSFYHTIRGLQVIPDELSIYKDNREIFKTASSSDQMPNFSILKQEFKDYEVVIEWSDPGISSAFNYEAALLTDDIAYSIDGTNYFKRQPYIVNNTLSLEPESFNIDSGQKFQVYVLATDGFRTYKATSQVFSMPVQEKPRFARIIEPRNSQPYYQNNVPLQSFSYDPRSSDKMSCGGCPEEGNKFLWISNIDGNIASAPKTFCQYLTPGNHTLTLIVNNENGMEIRDFVTITVLPSSSITEREMKERQQKGESCY